MKDAATPRYRQLEGRLESRLAAFSGRAPGLRLAGLALAAAAAARGDGRFTRSALRAALALGLAAEDLRESLLQTYLFAGYPRAINALSELSRLDKPSSAPLDLERDLGNDRVWLERGEALCRRVYGDAYDRLLATMTDLSGDLGRWMIVEGYGKVLSRPLLDARERELTALGALTVLRVPRQLKAHLRGALLTGATLEDVEGAVTAAGLARPAARGPALALLAETARLLAGRSPEDAPGA